MNEKPTSYVSAEIPRLDRLYILVFVDKLMNYRNLCFATGIGLLLSATVIAAEPEQSRLWVSRDGQYVRGVLAGLEGDVVVLKEADGRKIEVSLSDLSIEDRRYATRASTDLRPSESVEPVAPRPNTTTPSSPVTGRSPRSVLVSKDGDVELIPPPRPEPDELLPPPKPTPDVPAPDADTTTTTTDIESAQPAPKKELPKAIRTLRRLLNANADSQENGGSPLFGPESSIYISFSGKFLNEFIQVPIEQNGPVEETIMGMPVSGTADTRGMATLFLLPNADHAAFEIVASGRADSLTSGQQLIVNIESDGTTHFEARKRLEISSDGIDLFEASATAQTTVNRSAVSTPIGGRIGSLVGRIAGRIVEANRPQIDYEASQRAAYRAAKELDQRIDSEVVRVQQVLSEIAPGLAAGEPIIPIRFRTAKDRVAILIGEYEPPEWQEFGQQPIKEAQDITIVLPKKTVSTGQQLQMAMRLMSISLEDELDGVVKPEELTPKTQEWSPDKEWLKLVWDVDATVVELLSKDFLSATAAGGTALPATRVEPAPYYPNVPSWNQGGRRENVFRPR